MAVITLLSDSLLATVLGLVISLIISGRILNRIGGEPEEDI